MLAALTDAVALWALGVVKASERGGGMPHGKVIHPLPIIRGAQAPDPAASWEASGVMEMQRRGR